MILARDPVCVMCERQASVTVDHITPKHQGGQDEESNLQGLCSDCHQSKTAREGNAAKITRRQRPQR
jgi:5-methylcytosine-specific restriction enzyme A